MAKNSLVMGYILRKNKNEESSSYDRWFAFVDRMGVLSTRGLAEHMIEHGLVNNRSEVEGVLAKLSECIPELVAQGYSVKLDSIGIFYPTIANKKGGAASPALFNLQKNVEGVRFNFRADSTDLDDLTTKAFGKKVSFGKGYYQLEKGRKAAKYPLVADEENGGLTTDSGQGGQQTTGNGQQSTTLAAPTISGTTPFAETTSVTISGPADAEIHYTTDGTTPTSESSLYSSAITLSDSATVKAIAIKDGVTSAVTTKVFTKSSGDDPDPGDDQD